MKSSRKRADFARRSTASEVLSGSRAGVQPTNEYTNPILAGFYPDPSICRVGHEYYLVNSTFAYFPGIPVFQSADLVRWTLIGHAINRPETLAYDGLGVSRGIFAPTMRYSNGVYYITCTFVDGGGNFVVTAEHPAGPWSNPVWLPSVSGIDPSLFFDDDGKAYLVYNSVAPDNRPLYRGHRTIRMRGFDVERLRVMDDERILVNGGADITQRPAWVEGPHIFKVGGFYYLLAAEGGTRESHSEVVFRSASVGGPYTSYGDNPILTQRDLKPGRVTPVTCTGHADFVETPEGNWWAVFLGCRPYPPLAENLYNTGRETFLAPVNWKDGWPTIVPRGQEVPRSGPSPLPADVEIHQFAYGGSIHYSDDFIADQLDGNWVFLRAPQEEWYSLSERRGHLALKLRRETCSGSRNPTFLGRRQQHADSVATTAMEFAPASEHERAGLLVFQNESHYYFLCKSLAGGSPVLQLFKSAGSAETMTLLSSRNLDEAEAAGQLFLRIASRGNVYAFMYSRDRRRWVIVEEGVDATFLSTKVAGGFVGCMYALYAETADGAGNTAYFDWFSYTGADSAKDL